jgi:3-oxoacyl-[acyl-carrier protein] reductase
MFSLKNQHALVTGATGGIGSAVCASLLRAGVSKLAIVGRRADTLEQLKARLLAEIKQGDCVAAPPQVLCVVTEELSAHGSASANNAQPGEAEAKQPVPIKDYITHAWTALGGVDIVVCAAGCTRDRTLRNMTEEEWNHVLYVNLTTPVTQAQQLYRMHCEAAAAARVAASADGAPAHRLSRVVFVSSVVAHTGNFGQANYVAAKAALAGSAKTLAQEFAAQAITVNCVAPGFIKTAMTAHLPEAVTAAVVARTPAKCFGEPDDVAAAVVYLASREARFVTGHSLQVNGGLHCA